MKIKITLLSRVRGKFPTPYGAIEIEHKNVAGQMKTTYKAPKEITVIT